MLLIILKSIICLAVFMIFYKLALENTNAHTLKRFYLLSIVAVSIAIPLITLVKYVDPSITLNTKNLFPIKQDIEQQIINNYTNPVDYVSIILWAIYYLGAILFLFRFLKNISTLVKKIKTSPKTKVGNVCIVLSKDSSLPHTFFNYIFLNKNDYEKNDIDKGVFLHEQTHAIQKHSVDILAIEIVQVIFWFNPLLILLKRYIKLNHEFLADKAVLSSGISTSEYQKTLLSFSSNIKYPTLVNPINYSSLKKRFKIMKTQTSKSKLLLKALLLLPLCIISVYGFSQKETIIKSNNSNVVNGLTIKDIQLIIKNEDDLVLNGNKVTIENLKDEVNKLNPLLDNKQKQYFLFAYLLMEDDKLYPYTKKISNFLSLNCDIKSSQIVIVNGFNHLNLYKSPFNGKTTIEAQEILDKQTINFTPSTKQGPWKLKVGFNTADFTLNNNLDTNKSINQQDINEYNNLVEKFNNLSDHEKVVKVTDFSRLHELYRLIPQNKKADLKPFPDFLTPPKSDEEIIIEMIEKGVTCFFNDKKIDAEKAISIIKNNRLLKATTKHENGVSIISMYSESYKK
ncbi:M56 family metallopeptidase [Hyunsoonleella ulvae]|uniref:M56 family metallopeptidase n=1 Tax=Hyunsoonleella ulvae TaxID=2799948 RepID=UPI001939FFEC|nr:M56 family metallopeptidase [Hyunsoonleella ulvae]